MGPFREFDDPQFLSWSNLRNVATIGLAAGVVSGLFDAVVGGWGHVRVVPMVVMALWVPAVLTGLHLYLRPSRRKGSGGGST